MHNRALYDSLAAFVEESDIARLLDGLATLAAGG